MRPGSVRGKTMGPSYHAHRRQQSLGELPLRGIHININSDPFQHRIPPSIQRLWQTSRLRKHLSRCRIRLEQSTPLEIFALSVAAVMSCMVLLVHVGFFSGKKYQDWQHDHAGWLADVDLLDKVYPDEGRSLTTAIVILNETSPLGGQNVASRLTRLCQYDIFGKVLVWNNDPSKQITLETLGQTGCSPSRLGVYNAPSNMRRSARYLACAMAKTPYCYFQDEPFEPMQLRSTYASFLRHPKVVHTQAPSPSMYAQERWEWCFFHEDVQLHVCQAMMGLGTFVSRETVAPFVDLVELDLVDIESADMYFMTHLNQVPYVLEAHASLDHTHSHTLSTTDQYHMNRGLMALYQVLSAKTTPPFTEEPRLTLEEQTARSPCYNDRCLFLTNIDVFPDRQLFLFNAHTNFNVSSRLHNDYFDRDRYAVHPYSSAVDEHDNTAWRSSQHIRAGDYIGLDLLMPMRTPIRYRFLARHPYIYRRTLQLQISYDGLIWIDLRPRSHTCHAVDAGVRGRMALLECRFIIADIGYRFVRLRSKHNLDFGFELYDFSFDAKAKRDKNGEILDIGADDEGVAYVEDDGTSEGIDP